MGIYEGEKDSVKAINMFRRSSEKRGIKGIFMETEGVDQKTNNLAS